jgi:formate/nitrite transporter FocA (FNT family)
MWLFPNTAAIPIIMSKVMEPAYITWIEAALCNILIYFSVEAYKDTKNPILLIFGVAGFILAGFEHSIASLCFTFASHTLTGGILNYLTIVILGNALGGILIHQLRTRTHK